MNKKYHDKEYLRLVKHVLDHGVEKEDRTGTGTLSTFAQRMRFDLSDNSIPLLTTKKMHVRSIIHELLWFIRGCDGGNITQLKDSGVRIWDEWTDGNDNIGPMYGVLWRAWPQVDGYHATIDYSTDPPHPAVQTKYKFIDQLAQTIELLRTDPSSRRMIISSWDPTLLPDTSLSFKENIDNGKQALPPCHYTFQFHVNGDKLSCLLNMRSSDVFLGLPFNIAQYSMLIHMIAQVTGLKAHELIYSGGDVHIYKNHIEQVETQLKRKPYYSPTLKLNPHIKEIDDFSFEDIEIVDYSYHLPIRAKVSV